MVDSDEVLVGLDKGLLNLSDWVSSETRFYYSTHMANYVHSV